MVMGGKVKVGLRSELEILIKNGRIGIKKQSCDFQMPWLSILDEFSRLYQLIFVDIEDQRWEGPNNSKSSKGSRTSKGSKGSHGSRTSKGSKGSSK